MYALSEWVKYIILVILFATFIEFLLPNNNMQRFIRLILGLYVMMAILNPFITFIEQPREEQSLKAFATISPESKKLPNNAEKLIQERESLSVQIYKNELEKQIRALVLSAEGINDAMVIVDFSVVEGKEVKGFPSVKTITIHIQTNGATATLKNSLRNESLAEHTNRIVQLVNGIYQIPKEKIQVHFKST